MKASSINRYAFLFFACLLSSFFTHAQLTGDQQFKLGDSLRLQMQFEAASSHYHLADSLFALSNHVLGRLQVGIARSRMDLVNRAYEAAAQRVSALSSIVKEENIKGLEVAACYNILGAIAGEKESDYKQALQYHLRAVAELERDSSLEYDQTRARTQGAIGTCYEHMGDFGKAMEYYFQATQILKKIYGPTHMTVAIGHRSMASILSRRGYYREGIEAYKKALEIQEMALPKAHPLKLTVQQGIGENYLALGNFEKAQDWFTQSEIMSMELFGSASADLAMALHNQGKVYQQMGDTQKALEYFTRARAILTDVFGADKSQLVAIYSDIAAVFLQNGETKLALESEKEALALNLKIYGNQHPSLAMNYRRLGDIFIIQNKFAEAEDYYKKGLEILKKAFTGKHPEKAQILLRLAHLSEKKGRISEALQYCQEALIQMVTDFETKEAHQLPLMEELEFLPALLEIIAMKMKLFFQNYKTHKKETDLKHAYAHAAFGVSYIDRIIPHYEAGRTQNFWLEKAFPFYESALEIVQASYEIKGNQNDFWTGLQIADRSKSTLLLQHLQHNDAQIKGAVPDSLIRQERAFTKDLNFYQFLLAKAAPDENEEKIYFWKQQLLNTKKRYRAFIEMLDKKYPKYYQLKYDTERKNLSALTAGFTGNQEVIISYFLGKDRLQVFVIHQNETHWLTESIDSGFRQKVFDFIHLCSDQNRWLQDWEHSYAAMVDQGFYLYEVLLQKALDEMPDHVNQLIIVPDGILGYLPFELLITRQDKTDDIKDTNWLIKQKTLQYHFQLVTLLNKKEQVKQTKLPYLGFAANYTQTGESDELVVLPHAIEEVKAAQEIWKGKTFLSQVNLEQIFKREAPKANILHLALHAQVEDEQPQYSKFIFGTADSLEDNRLHTYEIFNLPLNAELAVLSACNTGKGKLKRGEGIMSLARGFRYAGVPGITMSLWKVNDVSSKNIILNYFRYLKKGEKKHEALRHAKLDHINSESKLLIPPYYWAGFVHIGDVSEINPSEKGWPWRYLLIIGFVLLFYSGIRRFLN